MDFPMPVGFAAWMACVAFALMLYNQGVKAKRNFQGPGPHPPNTQLGQSVTVVEGRVTVLEQRVDGVEVDVSSLGGDLVRHREAVDHKISQRSAGIYEEIRKSQAETRAHTDSVRRELSDKIDGLPAQIITTLRNTGAIGSK